MTGNQKAQPQKVPPSRRKPLHTLPGYQPCRENLGQWAIQQYSVSEEEARTTRWRNPWFPGRKTAQDSRNQPIRIISHRSLPNSGSSTSSTVTPRPRKYLPRTTIMPKTPLQISYRRPYQAIKQMAIIGISGSNFSSCVDVESGDADNACEKGVIDSQSLKNGDTLQDIEVDDMSPETSKSMSVKRFKFSPGMLIKQSQDDGIDEMTWRISPVNERLRAITKHSPGKIRVLGDSSRFNSLNFQQCSMKKMQTSPGMSSELQKEA
ncbi:uncharacterized protein LOC142522985 [Primulina tabacum]|uniref:uncharacterized protein LOC142522985 n=1 Tax=Primulina tabacum TaxID=48773 RepID=UPI003F59FCF7